MKPPAKPGPPQANADPAITAAVQAALLQEHAASAPYAQLASGVVATLLVVLLHPFVDTPALLGWLAALAAGGDGQALALLSVLLAGMAAGALTLTLFDLEAALLFAVPAVLPLAGRLLAAAAPLPAVSVVAGVLVALLLLVFSIAARRERSQRSALAAAHCAEAAGAEGARRSEALLRVIFDHIGEGISVFDAQHRLAAWNRHYVELTGMAPHLACVGTPLLECLRHVARSGEYGDVDPDAEAGRRLLELTNGCAAVTQRVRADGRTIEIRRRPTTGGGIVTVYVDITQRKQAEAQLRLAGELLAQKSRVLEVTLESLSQGVLSVDAGGRSNAYNQRLLELLALPESLMQGRPTLAELAAYQVAQGHAGPALAQPSEAGRDALAQRVKADGTVLEVRSHAAPDDSLVRTYTDITESVHAQQALRESETRFRSMADGAPALIWLSDADGRQIWFNQRWLEYTGHSMNQELATGWTSRMHPDDLERCRAAFDEAVGQRRRYDIEFRLRRADGGWGWIADNGVPRSGCDGRFEGYISYAWDISERKAAETALIAARDEAERASRAKTEFLSRMSHELRTPLNAILGFGQLLASDANEPLLEAQRARVLQVMRSGRQLLSMVNQVLDLAHTESGALARSTAPPAPGAAEATHERTVLYIEDNLVNQVLMEGMLAHRPGIRLLMSDVPATGLALAAESRPDLVLLDIQLPDIDGFEVLRRLRALPATCAIPVIAVSANAMPGDLEDARRAGFADYLTKPLDMCRLLEVVERALAV